jgi:hypothetical protein
MNNWQVSKDAISSFDTLASLLEWFENSVGHLKTYISISPTPELDIIVVKFLVELISMHALVTKKLGQGWLRGSTFLC